LGEEFGAVVGQVVFEDTEDGVEQFAHGGDVGLEFGLATRLEMFVEGAEVRGVVDGD
jgi:hypothetical protein